MKAQRRLRPRKGSRLLGSIIRATRESRGLSRSELAQEVDVSVAMIDKIENGHRPITNIDTAVAFADALNMSADRIYQIQGIPPPDIVDLVEECSTLHVKRMRWALTKIAEGGLFSEELADAQSVLPHSPKPVLKPRKRSVKEDREWARILEERSQ